MKTLRESIYQDSTEILKKKVQNTFWVEGKNNNSIKVTNEEHHSITSHANWQ